MKRRSNVRIKTLKLTGVDVGAREDETILQLAQENGIFIPTLCHMEGLSELWRLPPLHGRDQRLQPAATRLHDLRRRRDGGHHQL
jgi:hypothetical protein